MLRLVLALSGGVAQLGERLLCKQEVIGSIPFTSTTGAALRRRLSPSAAGHGDCASLRLRRQVDGESIDRENAMFAGWRWLSGA